MIRKPFFCFTALLRRVSRQYNQRFANEENLSDWQFTPLFFVDINNELCYNQANCNVDNYVLIEDGV